MSLFSRGRLIPYLWNNVDPGKKISKVLQYDTYIFYKPVPAIQFKFSNQIVPFIRNYQCNRNGLWNNYGPYNQITPLYRSVSCSQYYSKELTFLYKSFNILINRSNCLSNLCKRYHTESNILRSLQIQKNLSITNESIFKRLYGDDCKKKKPKCKKSKKCGEKKKKKKKKCGGKKKKAAKGSDQKCKKSKSKKNISQCGGCKKKSPEKEEKECPKNICDKRKPCSKQPKPCIAKMKKKKKKPCGDKKEGKKKECKKKGGTCKKSDKSKKKGGTCKKSSKSKPKGGATCKKKDTCKKDKKSCKPKKPPCPSKKDKKGKSGKDAGKGSKCKMAAAGKAAKDAKGGGGKGDAKKNVKLFTGDDGSAMCKKANSGRKGPPTEKKKRFWEIWKK